MTPNDEPADPMQEASKSRRPWTQIIVLCVILAVLAACLVPSVVNQITKARQTSSIRNLRIIGLALYEFESEYRTFPNATTATEIRKKTRSPLALSDHTSNDIFVQLLASGIATSERTFDTHSPSTRRPDGDWSSDATALAHGETGFAFVSGLSSKGTPSASLVFGPVIPGMKTLDTDAFEGKGVLLKLDNSVSSMRIGANGKIIFDDEELDPTNPIWNGDPFNVKWPK